MLINRAASDVAASRKRHLCSFVLAKQGPKQIIRRTNALDVLILYIKITNLAMLACCLCLPSAPRRDWSWRRRVKTCLCADPRESISDKRQTATGEDVPKSRAA